jgi:urease accessory protein
MSSRLIKNAPPVIHDRVVMDYDQRLVRRKLLTSIAGREFLVDLPSVTNLDEYWGFDVGGTFIRIDPAPEAVLVVTGDLTRLAWHIGNRHTPCQILPDQLIIREDRVLEQMLQGLGATIRHENLPFQPEGGAYGLGRTMGHSHGAERIDDDAAQFGWHQHGDSHLHFHPPKAGK